MLFWWVVIFVVALAVLIKSSDRFTASAERLGLHFGMPAFIVGVTIVSIGTSLPELISSIFATLEGSSEIIIGNVIGSNIANIFLILGVAALVGAWKKPILLKFNLASVDLPILLASSFLLGFTMIDGLITFVEALFFFAGFIIYAIYSVSKIETVEKNVKEEKLIEKQIPEDKAKKKFPVKDLWTVVICALLIFVGAKYTIDAVIAISEILHVGKEIIAVSAVALGTSLPELLVTVAAARRGGYEIALGNVFGSNIFNVFMVLSIPGFIGSIVVPQVMLTFFFPMMLVATILALVMMQDKEISKWEGLTLLLFYVFFLVKVFV